MYRYRIEYEVMGTGAPAPLYAYVRADNEEQARIAFYAKRDFYNTNDITKVVIDNIRLCK